MSWSRRALLSGLAATPLMGCFRPMLAEDSAAVGLQTRIALPKINDRFGYHLVKNLESRLGKPAKTEWRLDVQTKIEETGLGIAQDNAITRITLIARAEWSLFPQGSEEALLSDNAVSQSGYSSTTSLFATRQARRDIERRLARDLAERISRVILARANRLTAG